MSHNYTNYSKPNPKNLGEAVTGVEESSVNTVGDQKVVEETSATTVVEDALGNDTNTISEDPIVEETPVTQEDEKVMGKVIDCKKLRVRESASAEAPVVCEIPVDSEVLIDESGSTEEFYKVCTESGAEGYCMKKFIALEK